MISQGYESTTAALSGCTSETSAGQRQEANSSQAGRSSSVQRWMLERTNKGIKFADERSGRTWELVDGETWSSRFPGDGDLRSALLVLTQVLDRTGSHSLKKAGNYLQRLRARLGAQDLRDNIIFGLTVGWTLTLTGAFRFFFLLERKIWLWVSVSGLSCLAITILLPRLMGAPRKLAKVFGKAVGDLTIRLLTVLLYTALVLPMGLFLQLTRGRHPFYKWRECPQTGAEGWIDKPASDRLSDSYRTKRVSMIMQPLEIVGYFFRHGERVLLPVLIIFLVFGLLGVFVQSTALAPMIYTLF